MQIKFTLNVKPRTKKNHSIPVILKTGRIVNLPSKAYKEFEKEALMHLKTMTIPYTKNPIDYPINLKCVFYKDRNYKADLIGYLQAIQDTLVKAEILADDNHNIVYSTNGSRVELDRENPRIEVEITEIEREK